MSNSKWLPTSGSMRFSGKACYSCPNTKINAILGYTDIMESGLTQPAQEQGVHQESAQQSGSDIIHFVESLVESEDTEG